MNIPWFYISFLFLFAMLFNHLVLPGVAPSEWTNSVSFWLAVFASDVLFLLGAVACMLVALFVQPSGGVESETGGPKAADAPYPGGAPGSGYPV